MLSFKFWLIRIYISILPCSYHILNILILRNFHNNNAEKLNAVFVFFCLFEQNIVMFSFADYIVAWWRTLTKIRNWKKDYDFVHTTIIIVFFSSKYLFLFENPSAVPIKTFIESTFIYWFIVCCIKYSCWNNNCLYMIIYFVWTFCVKMTLLWVWL